jgi:hypothetical protein
MDGFCVVGTVASAGTSVVASCTSSGCGLIAGARARAISVGASVGVCAGRRVFTVVCGVLRGSVGIPVIYE